MTPANGIRVLLAEDHPLTSRGLRDTLEDEEGFEVAGQAVAGNMVVPQEAVRRAFMLLDGGCAMKPAPDLLSPRKREALTRFARGRAYAEIAEDMGIKKVTVRNAIYRVQNKLGLGSHQEIAVWPSATVSSKSSKFRKIRKRLG